VSAADLAIASVVLAGALWLLYRSVVRGQGACHGCSGGSCGKRPERPPELVRLGSHRKDG
jgi:hypothetical protein